jgi:ATP-dependent Zn protease
MSRASKERERQECARQHKAGVKRFDLTTQTAYHEAGHVVFSTLHGPGVEIVTIDPQKVEELTGRKGCPGYTQYNEEGRMMEADKVLVATAVGLTAEAMFVTGGVVNSAEDDISLLYDMLENQLGLHGEEKVREFDRIRLLTQVFVQEHRAVIETVAKALIERKTLTGEAVKQLVNG